jgi:hypothetical protein
MSLPRPWDVRELDAGNVRGLNVRGGSTAPDLPTPGKLLQFPTTPAEINRTFSASSARTKDVIRELARLGYEVEDFGEAEVELTEVGQGRMKLTLFLAEEFPIEIVRVRFGVNFWTARQAADWLRKRAAQ